MTNTILPDGTGRQVLLATLGLLAGMLIAAAVVLLLLRPGRRPAPSEESAAPRPVEPERSMWGSDDLPNAVDGDVWWGVR